MSSRTNSPVWIDPPDWTWLVDDTKLALHGWKLQFARRHYERLYAASFVFEIASHFIAVLANRIGEWGEH